MKDSTIRATDIVVPNDVSSAAFFIVAGLLLPNMVIRLPNIGLNPTRDGVIRVLLQMGGQTDIQNRRTVGGEPVGDLVVMSSSLTGVNVPIDWIPSMIDEIPILALAASQATGRTKILGAADLRKKSRIGSCNRRILLLIWVLKWKSILMGLRLMVRRQFWGK